VGALFGRSRQEAADARPLEDLLDEMHDLRLTLAVDLTAAAGAADAGANDVARDIHHGLLPVIKALMTTAANPVPIKSALNAMGFSAGPFRLPLVALADDQLKSVMKTIRDAGEYITFAKAGVKVA